MKKINFGNLINLDRKILYIILSVVLISIFSLTIVYAALSTTLNIQGNAQVVASSWDIHLDNVKVTNGSVSGNAPTITGPTTATFSTTLNMPGDFYEFTIDVVNDGSIDAMIDSVTKEPTLTTNQAKYLNYIVEYQNGESINTKQLVSKNSYIRLKVRVEFRKDIIASDLPTTSETLNLAFTVNYVQSDGTASSVKDNGEVKLINVISGDGTNKSDEVCIGEECFYVMYSDDTTITMLAKYNLYVGNECNYTSCTAYGEEATGKQDSTMLGYVSGQSIRKGTTKFSNTNYWSSTVSSYPSYVCDSKSTLYSYVENYKTYLSTLGVTPSEARLITKEEIETLGCSSSSYSCKSAPSWVYATSYWLGSAHSTTHVWVVYSDGDFDYNGYSFNLNYGCRPVIVISKDLIDNVSSTSKKIVEFSVDGVVYQAEEGMTWGEWVDSKYNVDNFYFNDLGYISGDYELDFCETKDDIIQLRDYSYNDTYGVGCIPPLN